MPAEVTPKIRNAVALCQAIAKELDTPDLNTAAMLMLVMEADAIRQEMHTLSETIAKGSRDIEHATRRR